MTDTIDNKIYLKRNIIQFFLFLVFAGVAYIVLKSYWGLFFNSFNNLYGEVPVFVFFSLLFLFGALGIFVMICALVISFMGFLLNSVTFRTKTFDWADFLDCAEAKEVKWYQELYASILAHRWLHCAVGVLPAKIQREPIWTSVLTGGVDSWKASDGKLYRLGCRFSDQISNREFAKARSTLTQISRRGAILLEEAPEPRPTFLFSRLLPQTV